MNQKIAPEKNETANNPVYSWMEIGADTPVAADQSSLEKELPAAPPSAGQPGTAGEKKVQPKGERKILLKNIGAITFALFSISVIFYCFDGMLPRARAEYPVVGTWLCVWMIINLIASFGILFYTLFNLLIKPIRDHKRNQKATR